jgi:hypothetical protein
VKKLISYFLFGAILIAPNIVAVNGAFAADNSAIADTLGATEQMAQNVDEGGAGTTATCAGTGALIGAVVFFPFGLLVGGALGGLGCWAYTKLN